MRADSGSGSVLAVGVTAAIVAVAGLGLSLGAALTERGVATAAADAGALAGADVAAGGATGVPCDRAAQVVAADGAHLTVCRQHGVLVEVGTSAAAGPFTASGRAVAGPPGVP